MGQAKSKHSQPPAYTGPQITYELTQFTLIYQLGKGTFCKVLASENKNTGQIMALKYCLKERLLEKKAINHIIQERNLLEDLNHPFICNIRYSFQDQQYVYMVLDLMVGGDLRVHMGSPMPEDGTRIIIAEVCMALEYLHSNNIVHRDIKPDNILLDEQGHAYLTDFNVAVIFKPGQPLRSVAGTEAYMAPELFSNSQIGYYSSVDWWSLGVVMFEMIFADRPFRGKNKRENIAKGEYRMPNSKFTHISSSCKTCISDMLQTSTTKRLGCGLEGMRNYRKHAFFKSKWTPKQPKNAVATTTPESVEKIKPIKWKKLEKKLIDPPFLPLAPRVHLDTKKKKTEKDLEAEKVKEAEKEADFNLMILQQRGEAPLSSTSPAEYPILDEKFLYFDHDFRVVREKKKKGQTSFVDLERVIRSCSSLLSLDNTNSMGGIKNNSKTSGLGDFQLSSRENRPRVDISRSGTGRDLGGVSAHSASPAPESNGVPLFNT